MQNHASPFDAKLAGFIGHCYDAAIGVWLDPVLIRPEGAEVTKLYRHNTAQHGTARVMKQEVASC